VHIFNSLYTQVKEGYFQQNVLSAYFHLSCLLFNPTSALSMSLMHWESRGIWKNVHLERWERGGRCLEYGCGRIYFLSL